MADPTTVTQYQTGFAPEIAPFAQDLLGQAQSVTDTSANPYQVYQGERQAAFTPMQMQSYKNAAMMQTAPQLQDATAMAGLAGMGALNTGYAYNPYSASQAKAGQLKDYQMGAPSSVSTQSFTTPGMAESFMNPYQQNVTDIGLRKANEQAGVAGAQRGAQAAASGAFGGSRQAIGDVAAASGLRQQLGDIQAQGSNAAYMSGMGQFNAQQAANLQAQQANQQAGLTAGGQNLNAMLGVQQLGSGQALQAQLANQQAQQNAAQLNAQQGQFGAGLGLQGLQTAMTGANTLGNLGQTQYGQNIGINQLQNQLGTQQQGQYQNMINNQYQDFLGAQNYPYKQLGFMSDMLRGLPLSTQGSSVYGGTGNTAAQLLGTGLNIASGAGAFGTPTKAEGGVINGYAEGGMPISRPSDEKLTGMMSTLDDKQLTQILDRPISLAQFKQAQEEVAFRKSTRGAGIASALPNPESQVNAAGGGIIAFAEGSKDAVEDTQAKDDKEAMFGATSPYEKMKAAGKDVLTMPGRGLAGAAESVITRPLRAMGVPVPYLPESFYGGDRSSATPYMDVIRKKELVKEQVKEEKEAKDLYAALPPTRRKDYETAAPQPKPKAKPAPTAGKGISSALDSLSAQSGESRENLDTAFDRIYGKLRESSKADLDELHNAMKEYAKRPDEIRANSMNAMIGKFGAALAKSGSKPGATFLGSLAEGSAAIPESMADTDKLVREAQDMNIKAKEADARFRISLNRGDKTAAMQELSIKRQLEQGQASLAEQSRSNKAREGLQGKQIAATTARYAAGMGSKQYGPILTALGKADDRSIRMAKDYLSTPKGMQDKRSYDEIVNGYRKSQRQSVTSGIGFGPTGEVSDPDDTDEG